MVEETVEVFTGWLNQKLREWNTDESIFGSYIVGILQGDETHEEKTEALEGILSEINDDGNVKVNELVAAIQEKWCACQPASGGHMTQKAPALDVEEQLSKLLETQKLQPAVKERHYTEEERRIREQILAQYSQTEVSDEDAVEDGVEESTKPSGKQTMTGIDRNTNVQDVLALQKERREQARADSAAKKQKDREDREKQRQLREEKKEKRKTVKGERRR